MAAGNVYVANWYGNDVRVYAAGGKPALHEITSGVAFPNSLTFDKSGSLYVGNYGAPSGSINSSVSVYRPGNSQPQRVITDGIRGPYALAIAALRKALRRELRSGDGYGVCARID